MGGEPAGMQHCKLTDGHPKATHPIQHLQAAQGLVLSRAQQQVCTKKPLTVLRNAAKGEDDDDDVFEEVISKKEDSSLLSTAPRQHSSSQQLQSHHQAPAASHCG